MKITKKIQAIRSWSEENKQKTLSEVEKIVALPCNITTVKTSARVAQLSAAALQFKTRGFGSVEAKQIMWA